MEFMIFLLIATFCIAQEKGYPGDFPKAILLKEAQPLLRKNGFRRCYLQRKHEHEQAVVNFSYKVKDAGNILNNNLGSIRDFKKKVPDIQKRANEFGNLLEDYQKKFSKFVEESKFKEVEDLMTEYENKIENESKKIIQKFLILKDTTAWSLYLKKIKEGERNILSEIDEVAEDGKETMKKLKACIEKKN